jgi:hypothetical protein
MTYEEDHLLSLVSTLGQRHAESGYLKDPDCEGSLCFKFTIILIDSLSMNQLLCTILFVFCIRTQVWKEAYSYSWLHGTY